ncbi:MAG TPA: hypothetical protein DCE55_17930 [Planctomycetaceae bacterium]|nr:hypothetical protein [Planctomycetaceae bacterium]
MVEFSMNVRPQQPDATNLNPACDSNSGHRYDAAHYSRVPSPDHNVTPTALPEVELLQRQTQQLETHLKQRLHELDRREAQVHASCAQLESDLRIARMWWLDHQCELQEHEQFSSKHVKHSVDDNTQPAAVTRATKRPLASDEQQRTDLETLRINLGLAESPAPTTKQGHPSPHNTEANPGDIHETTLHTVLETLKHSASRLHADQRTLAQEREAWQQERMDQEAELKHREQQLEKKVTRAAQRLQQRRALLSRMSKTVAAWDEQAVQHHRASLEARWVAEQLYHDLQATVPSGQLRDKRQAAQRRLEQHYHNREAAAQQRQLVLNQQTAQLHRQQAELAKQRATILQETESQRRKIAQLTARLVERQRQLDRREQLLRQQRQTWQNEQYQQQQAIYQLLTERDYVPTPPAAGSHSQ